MNVWDQEGTRYRSTTCSLRGHGDSMRTILSCVNGAFCKGIFVKKTGNVTSSTQELDVLFGLAYLNPVSLFLSTSKPSQRGKKKKLVWLLV